MHKMIEEESGMTPDINPSLAPLPPTLKLRRTGRGALILFGWRAAGLGAPHLGPRLPLTRPASSYAKATEDRPQGSLSAHGGKHHKGIFPVHFTGIFH